MLIAFLTSITLLPALLSMLKPRSEPRQLGYAFLAPVDEFLERHRMPILIVTALIIVGASPLLLLAALRFQSDESAQPQRRIGRDLSGARTRPGRRRQQYRGAGAFAGCGRRSGRQAAGAAASRARNDALDASFPTSRSKKLPLIRSAAETLDPALNPPATISQPPTDADNVAAINSHRRRAQSARRRRARPRRRRRKAPCRGDGDAAEGRSGGAPARRRGVRAAAENRARRSAQPAQGAGGHPRQPAARTGRINGSRRTARRGSMSRRAAMRSDNATLRTFAHAVQKVEPNATEGPISILEARRTIITAFLEAGALGAAVDRHPAVDHVAAAGRRAADAHPAAGGRRGHAGNLRA